MSESTDIREASLRQRILRIHQLALASAVSITSVGLVFNQFLPTSVGGDAVKVWQSKGVGLLLTSSGTTLLPERFGSLRCIAAPTVVLSIVLALTGSSASLPDGMFFVIDGAP